MWWNYQTRQTLQVKLDSKEEQRKLALNLWVRDRPVPWTWKSRLVLWVRYGVFVSTGFQYLCGLVTLRKAQEFLAQRFGKNAAFMEISSILRHLFWNACTLKSCWLESIVMLDESKWIYAIPSFKRPLAYNLSYTLCWQLWSRAQEVTTGGWSSFSWSILKCAPD